MCEDAESDPQEESWPPDPLLDEVDAARLQILAEHGNDRHKVWEHYREGQKQYADRLISNTRPPQKGKSAA